VEYRSRKGKVGAQRESFIKDRFICIRFSNNDKSEIIISIEFLH